MAKAKTIDKSTLARQFLQEDPTLASTTLDWWVHRLLQAGQLASIGRGQYTLKTKADYLPLPNPQLQSLSSQLRGAFPYLNYCLFHSEQLSPLMRHVPGRHFVVLETERDAMEAVFRWCQDLQKPAFLKPDAKTMELYVHLQAEPILVQPLISEAPIMEPHGCPTFTLEKLLVDLFCEKSIYGAYQGAELAHIFRNAFDSYHLRKDRLLRYSDRRKRKREVNDFLAHCGLAIP